MRSRGPGLRHLAWVAALLLWAGTAGAQQAGVVRGQIFDRETGNPVQGVHVVLRGPLGEGQTPVEQAASSADEGQFEFRGVVPGSYDVSFTREGYRTSTMTNFEVLAASVNRADFPLPPLTQGGGQEVLELEAFVVEASTVEDEALGLELRLESDQVVNTFSAKDFSKFSAGDVAEALERVAGVTIQEGQFAVIRGLEDRYNSVTYNGAPVPSPDPDRQSVQLDLFPSDVVSNLVVAKTFSPELPSNSSGGSIDIVTHDYPQEVTLGLKAGTGLNTNAEDAFYRFDGRTNPDKIFEGIGPDADLEYRREAFGFRFIDGNPVGRADDKSGDGYDDLADVLESDYSGSFAGRKEFEQREYRWKLVWAKEIDYDTAFGMEQGLEPRPPRSEPGGQVPIPGAFPGCIFNGTPCFQDLPATLTAPGDLAFGELNLNDGRYDYTASRRTERLTRYAGIGFDFDPEGHHSIDASYFFTDIGEERVEQYDNGYIPGLDYRKLFLEQLNNDFINENPEDVSKIPEFDFGTDTSPIVRRFRETSFAAPVASDGTLAAAPFFRSFSFQRDRDLRIYQVNGDHDLDYGIPGLHVSWAMNWARTNQEEVSLGMLYFYEPCGFVIGFECSEGTQRITADQVFPDFGPISRGVSVSDVGEGFFVDGGENVLSSNLIEEKSRFGRLDLDWEFAFSDWSVFTAFGGMWHERASRDVDSAFLQFTQRVTSTTDPDAMTGCVGDPGDSFCVSPDNTPLGLGRSAFDSLVVGDDGRLGNLPTTQSSASRKITAYYLSGKWQLWDRLDLLGGARFEDIFIESINDPFVTSSVTGDFYLGGPAIFPTRYLYFDRIDNPRPRFVTLPDGSTRQQNEPTTVFPPADTVFNDQLVGIPVPVGECLGGPLAPTVDEPAGGATCVDFFTRESLEPFLNGRIDEDKILPSAGFTLRPIEGLTLRGAYSETIARPSFRELGYYVSVEPGTSDLVVGNPLLRLSEVQSYDLRGEYTWGTRGSLLAFSWFWKDIEDPIEAITLRDPSITNNVAAVFKTFFNNENIADLSGYEIEGRMDFGFLSGDFSGGPSWWPDLGGPRWLRYLSIGGNYTRIFAEVARSDFEVSRGQGMFLVEDGVTPLFTEVGGTRRLFNQPEFIFNIDVTLDNPDWGTQITVAYFQISDRLEATGSTEIDADGFVRSYTVDRYIDGYEELRAIISQEFRLPGNFGKFVLKLTGKNLTDSKRRRIYDPSQTSRTFVEREFKVGREFDVSLTYTRTF